MPPCHVRKLVENAKRLALVLAANRRGPRGPKTITFIDVADGFAIAEYCFTTFTDKIQYSISDSEAGRELNRIFGFIERAGANGIAKGVLLRRANVYAKNLNMALDSLEQQGRIFKTDLRSGHAYFASKHRKLYKK